MFASAHRIRYSLMAVFFALATPLSAADNTWTNAATTFGWNFSDANWTLPALGGTTPLIVLMSVVLPAPFAPITATIEPDPTVMSTPFRTSMQRPSCSAAARPAA